MKYIIIILALVCLSLIGCCAYLYMQLKETETMLDWAHKANDVHERLEQNLKEMMSEMKWDHISEELTAEKAAIAASEEATNA